MCSYQPLRKVRPARPCSTCEPGHRVEHLLVHPVPGHISGDAHTTALPFHTHRSCQAGLSRHLPSPSLLQPAWLVQYTTPRATTAPWTGWKPHSCPGKLPNGGSQVQVGKISERNPLGAQVEPSAHVRPSCTQCVSQLLGLEVWAHCLSDSPVRMEKAHVHADSSLDSCPIWLLP